MAHEFSTYPRSVHLAINAINYSISENLQYIRNYFKWRLRISANELRKKLQLISCSSNFMEHKFLSSLN